MVIKFETRKKFHCYHSSIVVTQAATAARHSQRPGAGNKIYQDWRGPGGNRARDLSNMGPWSRRMLSFRVDFGARRAFSGSFLVCCAPFLGSILVRGVWCADFGADFGARCAVFGLDFGARCAVRRF